jgi:hypothetical protein
MEVSYGSGAEEIAISKTSPLYFNRLTCRQGSGTGDFAITSSARMQSFPSWPRSLLASGDMLEHDPEKWKPVFPRDKRGTRLRGDHAQTKGLDHGAILANRIMI